MRVSRYGFVCLIVLLCVCLAGHACFATEKPLGNFRYTLSVSGHSVVVAASKNGKHFLKLDGKEGKPYGEEQIGAEAGRLSLGLQPDGSLGIDFGVDRDNIDIEIFPASGFHINTKNATKLYVGNKVVFRERDSFGDTASPDPSYVFHYSINKGGLAFVVTQITPVKNKNMTKENSAKWWRL